jgi:hypothetical protein
MSTKTQANQLMSEIGPLLDLVGVVESDDGHAWLLIVDEDDALSVELDDARGSLVIAADVGTPGEAGQAQLYELLLAYNALWDVSGGVYMALDEPGGRVLQLLDLPAEGLDPSRLAEVLARFLEIRLGWMQVVSAIGAGAAPSEVEEMIPSAIRA